MKKKQLRSLYRTFDAIAKERRYFVRSHAPKLRALKTNVWDALKRKLPFFVAMDDDELVGWIGITFPDIPALAHSGTLVMGLLPEYRRQGIGSMLLERAVSRAFDDQNRLRIQLEVIKDNEAAIAFYTKHGFSIEGVAERAILLNDEYKDIVHMALLR